jgi:group I intron endonuclease
MDDKSGIYMIECSQDHKRYVGSTYNFTHRKNGHFNALRRGDHCNAHLQCAYNKYGESAFAFRILFYCDKKDLLVVEQMAIDCIHPEFNILEKAYSSYGYKHSEETKRKLRNKVVSESTKNLLRQQHLGKKASKETREKMRKARLGKPWFPCTPETKERLRIVNLGKKHPRTEQQRINLSNALKGHPVSQETREKLRLISLHMSEETKNKMRVKRLGRKESEETKQKKRFANLKRYHPEMFDETGELRQ